METRRRNAMVVTRSGIEPDFENDVPFKITTIQVENYLQKKIDMAVHKARAKNPDLEDVNIRVFTTTMFGNDFLPFVMALPTTALADDGRKKRHKPDGELGIFNPRKDTRFSVLRDEIFTVVKAFKYTDVDKEKFRSRQNGEVRFNYRKTPSIIGMIDPKTMTVGSKHSRYTEVVVLIDPMRVLSDMVKDSENPNEKFRIEIRRNETTKLKDGIYQYKILKHYGAQKKNKKGKSDGNLNKELEAAMNNDRYYHD